MSQAKFNRLRKLSTNELVDSLAPGTPGSLKVQVDGTIMEGHHRIHVLRERGMDVDSLPREVIAKD